MGSHKYAGKSALHYKLGVNILRGESCVDPGPIPAGSWPDIKIVTSCLAHFREPGEHVEAEDGYCGHPGKIKCLMNMSNPQEKLKMQSHVRSHHEMLNGCLKNWGILSQVICHDIRHHGDVFGACVVVTQLTIEDSKPPCEVEYDDNMMN